MDTPHPKTGPTSTKAVVSLSVVLVLLILFAAPIVPGIYVGGYFALGVKGSARLANGRLIWFRVYPTPFLEKMFRPLARIEAATTGETIDTASR
jgi:hypothetical protein